MEKGAIIILDDDDDDLEFIATALKEIKNDRPVLYFRKGEDLLEHLKTMDMPPFLVLSDINMPGLDGFAIKKQIASDPSIRYKSLPFLFWSTTEAPQHIQSAYDLCSQGFFVKPFDYHTLCNTLRCVIEYWQISRHPKMVS